MGCGCGCLWRKESFIGWKIGSGGGQTFQKDIVKVF